MTQRPRTTFGDLVMAHLRELEWSQNDLSHYADLPAASISGWLNGQPNPERKHVNRIACALAVGYERKDRTEYNIGKLDILLNELLEAVGISAIVGAPKKSVWIRLAHQESAERRLVTGWVNYPYFSYGDEAPSGLAVEIMQRIALFMGCKLDWRRYTWSKVLAALEKREIDIICPILLVLPTRMFHARFADPLPELRIWLNGVVHQPYRTYFGDSLSTPRNLGRLALSYVAGEAGEDLCAMFAHEAAKVRSYEQTADFIKDINESPKTQDGKIKCLVADHTICAQLVKEHHDLALIYNDPTRSGIELSIAGAVHRDEPDLLNLINMCMAVMKNTGYFKNLYSQHSDAKHLRQLRALAADENDRDRQRPQIIDEFMRARRHRSRGLKPGELRQLGTIHMHVDGGGKSDLVLDIVKALEKRGAKGKLSVITRSVAGPQRERYPDVYKIHTPGIDDEESLEYFSTTGLSDRKVGIETIQLILPQLMEHPGAVLEVECVIGTIIDGEWKSAKGVSPIRQEEVRFDKSPTLPFEIHHAFDVPMEAGPALDLDELLADVTELGIPVGGWFTFLKNEREWSYRSNAFVEKVHLEEYTMAEYKKLADYLKRRKIQAQQWTIVEEVLGIWKIPERNSETANGPF